MSDDVRLQFADGFDRKCGDCQLCCKLLPIRNFKPGNKRCKHQRHGKGCAVYHRPGMPRDCAIWNCRWLCGDDTADLSRPDRAHYVIDIMPDYVRWVDNATGNEGAVEVVQVWCDPGYPDAALRDPHFRNYVERLGAKGKAALLRYPDGSGITLVPPQMSSDGQWHVVKSMTREPEHSIFDLVRELGANGRQNADANPDLRKIGKGE
jgi:hypothetical protein